MAIKQNYEMETDQFRMENHWLYIQRASKAAYNSVSKSLFFSTRYICMSSTFDLLVLESYEMHIVLTVNLHTMLLAGHT